MKLNIQEKTLLSNMLAKTWQSYLVFKHHDKEMSTVGSLLSKGLIKVDVEHPSYSVAIKVSLCHEVLYDTWDVEHFNGQR